MGSALILWTFWVEFPGNFFWDLIASAQEKSSLESEREKLGALVRNLQRELEESAEETEHWRETSQKNKEELRNSKQE